MMRMLIRVGLALAGNAIGLWVASLVLDKMDVSGTAFVIAVVIFTVLTAVLEPLTSKVAREKAPVLEGGSALITTFLALLITSIVSDGLDIDGVGTWLLATLLVWIVTVIAGVILARIFLRDARDSK